MNARAALSLLLLFASAAPALGQVPSGPVPQGPQGRPDRPTPVGNPGPSGAGSSATTLFLDLGLTSVFDGGLVLESGDTGTYGGEANAALRFQTRGSRSNLQLEYAAATRAYHATEMWNRTGHRFSALYGRALAGGLRVDAIGNVALDGVGEENERINQYTLTPRLEYRLDRSNRVRAFAGARWRQEISDETATLPSALAGVEYRRRFGRERSLELGYRLDQSLSEDYSAAERQTFNAEFDSRLTRRSGVALELGYRMQRYPYRVFRVDGEERATEDRLWLPALQWIYERGPTELRLSYGFEHRTSNDARRDDGNHRVSLGLRRSVAFFGSGRPQLFDQDPWNTSRRGREGAEFVSASVGAALVCGVNGASQGYCWRFGGARGARRPELGRAQEIAGGREWAQVSVGGGAHSCGVTTAGEAYCWSHAENVTDLASGFVYPPAPAAVPGGLQFTEVTTGFAHACGLTPEGRAYCWGKNSEGALGTGTFRNSLTPVPVAGKLKFRSLSAGVAHTCGVSDEETVYCWGRNEAGQLGSAGVAREPEPRPIPSLHFVAVSANGRHTCGLTPDGAAFCWGANEAGQLGFRDLPQSGSPVPVAGGHRFLQLSAGWAHTCGVTDGQRVLCWGENRHGQLGQAAQDEHAHPLPLPVATSSSARYRSVTASLTTCAVDLAGALSCWGGGSQAVAASTGKSGAGRAGDGW